MIAIVRFGENLKGYTYYTTYEDLVEGDVVVLSSPYKSNYNVGYFYSYTDRDTIPKQYIIARFDKKYFEEKEMKILERKEQEYER